MAEQKYICSGSKLTALADVVRKKAKSEDRMTIDQMANAVSNIKTGNYSVEVFDITSQTASDMFGSYSSRSYNFYFGSSNAFGDLNYYDYIVFAPFVFDLEKDIRATKGNRNNYGRYIAQAVYRVKDEASVFRFIDAQNAEDYLIVNKKGSTVLQYNIGFAVVENWKTDGSKFVLTSVPNQDNSVNFTEEVWKIYAVKKLE